ncbi:hypothetical protein D3C85_1590500 [compost metagenome]
MADGQIRHALAGRQHMQAGRPEAQQLLDVGAGTAGAQQVQVVEDQGEAFRSLLQPLEDGMPQSRFRHRTQSMLGNGQT